MYTVLVTVVHHCANLLADLLCHYFVMVKTACVFELVVVTLYHY